MELGFTPKTVRYLKQVLHTGYCREETADTIVPDSCPDVCRIVGTYAVPVLRTKECRQGSVTVSGGIRANVIYIGEGEAFPRSLEIYLPFTHKEDCAALTENASVQCRLFIRSADARAVNSRKVMARVNLCIVLTGYEPTAEVFQELSKQPAALQAHSSEYELCLTADTAERSFQLTEEVSLPAGKPLCGDVFCFKPSLEITEKRLAGNKAVFKGLAHLRLLYATEGGAMVSFDAELPFSQYCELQDIYDSDDLNIDLLLTGCELDRTARQEGDGLLLTLHILAQCRVDCKVKITVCDDAYTPNGFFTPQWETHKPLVRLDRQNNTYVVRQSWQGSASNVADAGAYADLPRIMATENGTEITVPVTVQMLYYDENGQLQGTSVRTEHRETVPMAENARCSAKADVIGDVAALPTATGIELRYPLFVEVETSAENEFRTVCGGEYQEGEKTNVRRPAVVARRMAGGERLWDVAKANGTTVERIRSANRLETEIAEAGVLLIPT